MSMNLQAHVRCYNKIVFIILVGLLTISNCAAALDLADTQVIVRTWFSTPMKYTTADSYQQPDSCGHVSLEIPSKQQYLSFWPKETFLVMDPSMQDIQGGFAQSYVEDIINMGRHADHIVCLYKLDVSVLAQLIGQAKQAKLWRALSSVSYKFEAHNCASIVLSVLLQPICPSDQSLQSMDDNQEALAYANDSIFPTQDRKEYLKGITTNSGSVVKRWKKDIEQERSFEPFPKIDLDKVPPFVTPGFVNLWVRNLSALERNQSFVLRWITPPYREKVEVKPMNYSARASEKDRSYWSWRLPIASFIRTYVPGYRSYIGEHIIWDAGLFLLTGIAASKNPDSKTTKTLVVSFLYSISNSLRTLIFRQFYGRTRRLESHAS